MVNFIFDSNFISLIIQARFTYQAVSCLEKACPNLNQQNFTRNIHYHLVVYVLFSLWKQNLLYALQFLILQLLALLLFLELQILAINYLNYLKITLVYDPLYLREYEEFSDDDEVLMVGYDLLLHFHKLVVNLYFWQHLNLEDRTYSIASVRLN